MRSHVPAAGFSTRPALAAALVLAFPVSGAAAEEADEVRTILFNSVEAGRSSFASVGFKRGLAPLREDGWLLMVQAGAGSEREKKSSGEIDRYTMQAGLSVGYQWSVGRTYVALLAGPEWEREDRVVADEERPSTRSRFGGRMQVELWYRPWDDLFVTGTLVAKTTRGEIWSRVSAGYRAYGPVFIGPEAAVYSDPSYLEWRVGVHMTDLPIFGTTFRISGGWQQDENRGGAYVAVAGYRPF